MKANVILYFLCISVVYKRASASLQPNGLNVCSKQQSFNQVYVQSFKTSINKQVSYKCRVQQNFWIYKTCYRNQVVYKTVNRNLYRVAYRTIYECCSGWQQSGTSCPKPICSQGCVNGNCTKPNVCTCLSGYHGNSCSKPCPANRWGPGCTNTCQCINNATCDMRNGFCSCAPGWIGKTCAESCPQGFFGNHCYRKCVCQNGARCHHVTGTCTCVPGWTGQYCESVCNAGSYGDKCQHTCRCQNNATCDHVTGACTCRPGYKGSFCEKICDSGYYGNGCKERCNCVRGSCDHVKGTCSCPKGYVGGSCNKLCPDGLYGTNCSHHCSCPINSTCTVENGTCVCNKGFTGESCNKRCSNGYYGSNCQSECRCHGDKYCEPVDGNCTCGGNSCYESKARNEKQTGDSLDLTLPIALSVSAVFVLVAVFTACVAYRKCRSRNKEPQGEPDYEVTVNAGCRDGKYGESDVNDFVSNKPSYMELAHVGQSRDQHVYQGLKSRDMHELKSRDIGNDDSGINREMYQPLNADTKRIYQPLNKTIDNVTDRAVSPVIYGNSQSEKSRVDDSELYLTILPDHDVSGQSNVIYENRYPVPGNSPVLYGNVSNGEGTFNEDEVHEYFTVLPDDEARNQPTYEILPKKN